MLTEWDRVYPESEVPPARSGPTVIRIRRCADCGRRIGESERRCGDCEFGGE